MDNVAQLGSVEGHATQGRGLSWIGPLGPGKELSRNLTIECPGRARQEQFISIYVIIEYRDIFENNRTTSLGYTVDTHGNINRQEALLERNRNT